MSWFEKEVAERASVSGAWQNYIRQVQMGETGVPLCFAIINITEVSKYLDTVLILELSNFFSVNTAIVSVWRRHAAQCDPIDLVCFHIDCQVW